MRFLRSAAAIPILIIMLLATITAAGLAKSWTPSLVMWLTSAIVAAVLFTVLLRDSD